MAHACSKSYSLFRIYQGNYLIKELQNSNHLKRDLEQITKPAPKTRLDRIKELMAKLKTRKESLQEMHKWNLSISESFIELNATVLRDEQLFFGEVSAAFISFLAATDIRSAPFFSTS